FLLPPRGRSAPGAGGGRVCGGRPLGEAGRGGPVHHLAHLPGPAAGLPGRPRAALLAGSRRVPPGAGEGAGPEIEGGVEMAVKRALISVYDKQGIVEFAQGLAALGVEIISTGGTYRTLEAAGVPVREVAEVAGFPEILDGRVKTLQPQIHAGI